MGNYFELAMGNYFELDLFSDRPETILGVLEAVDGGMPSIHFKGVFRSDTILVFYWHWDQSWEKLNIEPCEMKGAQIVSRVIEGWLRKQAIWGVKPDCDGSVRKGFSLQMSDWFSQGKFPEGSYASLVVQPAWTEYHK